MSTRKIKDAIDLETNEAIYFIGHAKATYMSDGTLVEDAVNGKVSKVEGKQLSTEDFTTALKTKLESLESYDDSAIEFALQELRTDFDTLVSGDTATAIESFNEIIAFLDGVEDSESLDSIIASIEQQIAAKQDKITDLETIRQGASKGATAVQSSDLASVATSGSYEDLSDKPIIPSAVTESTVSGWGFTKNSGTYSKPSSGIPKSDLASAVQTSLGKADTALQSYTEQYTGTITGIKMNGASKGTSGVVDLGTVITAHQDISGKQDTLVSGTNIKTINGTSILGSGNIVIEGGSGSSSGGSSAYSEVSHGTSDTTFELTPNTFHVWDEVTELSLTFGSETSGVANEYLFQFTSGSTATTLTLPDDIKWANDSAPTIAENMIYQISVLKGLASVLEFSNASSVVLITFTIGGVEYYAEEGMIWRDWVDSLYNTGDFYYDSSSGTIKKGYTLVTGISVSDAIISGHSYTTYDPS